VLFAERGALNFDYGWLLVIHGVYVCTGGLINRMASWEVRVETTKRDNLDLYLKAFLYGL
jgi:hypothetical protein